ncbi:FAD-dependent oxidoreductase [Pseudomonas typographi]|uniref:FAD-dependent oxidoreductase n=1 Tax=Pseudomonas typographi TaxID=2715964 RepID=UPI001686C4F9|nr:FAD-dependent oxidoreductase [Pseudomonas typographi]MBD1553094.1 FAD-dependent oxidoreductase [Pseudomonas typographi]
MTMKASPQWDDEVDLLVIGAGAAGMATALVATLQGLNVRLVEKSAQVGGTASTSAGTLWIPGNRQGIAAGYHDCVEDGRRYLRELVGNDYGWAAREAFLSAGPDAIDFYMANTQVQLVSCGKHPDYMDRPGSAVFGRALVPQPFDGRQLGSQFKNVRAPIPEFLIFGGMMVGKDDIPRLVGRFKSLSNFVYSGKLFARFLFDRLRYPRGTRLTMGNALVARLYASLLDAQTPVQFDTGLKELVQDNGQVLGAVLESAAGQLCRVRATHGVVLATGGFARNSALRKAFIPYAVPRSVACETNQGEGIEAAMRVGAHVNVAEHSPGGFWTPVSDTTRKDGSKGVFPHLSLDRAKPGLIAVNAKAERFVNEANSYHDFVTAMLACGGDAVPAYLICTVAFIKHYGLGLVPPGASEHQVKKFAEQGYLKLADDLRSLAALIGLSPDALARTVKRYNDNAAKGVDPDFGKGSTELNRFNGDPAVTPNPCLAPLLPGPVCALAVWPAEIAGSTGLAVNEHGQVLTAQGTVMPGLYACGNDMESVMKGTYPGPGTTLGPALTFGYIIARHASGSGAGEQSAPLAVPQAQLS